MSEWNWARSLASYQTENMAGQKVEKAVVFDEEDELWARLRHTHIADTLIAVNEEAVKVASTDPAAKVRFQKAQSEGEGSSGSGAKSLKQISQLARSMPEHAARVTKVRRMAMDHGKSNAAYSKVVPGIVGRKVCHRFRRTQTCARR